MSSSLVKCLWCMFKCCRPPIYIPYRCNLPVQSPDSGQARQTLSISAGIFYPNDSNNDTNTRAHTNYTYLEEFICLNIFPMVKFCWCLHKENAFHTTIRQRYVWKAVQLMQGLERQIFVSCPYFISDGVQFVAEQTVRQTPLLLTRVTVRMAEALLALLACQSTIE